MPGGIKPSSFSKDAVIGNGVVQHLAAAWPLHIALGGQSAACRGGVVTRYQVVGHGKGGGVHVHPSAYAGGSGAKRGRVAEDGIVLERYRAIFLGAYSATPAVAIDTGDVVLDRVTLQYRGAVTQVYPTAQAAR